MPSYLAPFWLPGRHLQTIAPALWLDQGNIRYKRMKWKTPDKDVIALDWLPMQAGKPLTVLFHGLEGSSQSHYAKRIMREVWRRGENGVVVHFRGCGGLVNRTPRSYHAGDSAEIDWILKRLLPKHGRMRVIGVSLGGNVVLKWLGEQGSKALPIVEACVTISAPLSLPDMGRSLGQGVNKLYARSFLNTLKPKALALIQQHQLPFKPERILACKSLWEFDSYFTAPLHGFRNADDYWNKSNARPLLPLIQVPTLLINATNDPFLPAQYLPKSNELSSAIQTCFLRQGGHAGFWGLDLRHGHDWLASTTLNFISQTSNEFLDTIPSI